MSEDEDPFKPSGIDAVAVSSKKQRCIKSDDGKHQKKGASSLVARCRAVVVANLERYPPESLGMLAENDWEDLVQSRHRKTAPQKGTGGLDGTGRRTPALSERFLSEVEGTNPHLAESNLADELLWRDIVEYRFNREGLTRPRALLLPWPVLVKQIADLADIFSDCKKKEEEADGAGELLELTPVESRAVINATINLTDSPMNLALLKDSGIGKALKKLIKASSNRSQKSVLKRLKMPISSAAAKEEGAKELSVLKQLERLLQSWVDLAASLGVAISSSPKKKMKGTEAAEQLRKDEEDLQRAEKCQTWRQLFAVLSERTDQRRHNLGMKMRANRKKENAMRPQIVKVRPTNPRREKILDKSGTASTPTWQRGGSTVASHGGKKIFELRKEAAIQSARQKTSLGAINKASSGFGSAVAFAAKPKMTPQQRMKQQDLKSQQKLHQQKLNSNNRKRKAAPVVSLGNGKRMAVPQRQMRMQGGTFSNKKPVAKPQQRK